MAGKPNCFSTIFVNSMFRQPGKLGGLSTTPVLGLSGPGAQMPMPDQVSDLRITFAESLVCVRGDHLRLQQPPLSINQPSGHFGAPHIDADN
jgi:hypothetical protein